ncbi:unnamed protein product [Trichobilharzia regenti]|nr:unnamed protein product [Trichobilharzia regenti]
MVTDSRVLLACAMLKHLPEYANADIIRTRDSSILSTCDIVVDCGGVFNAENHLYDHHQRGFTLTYKDFFPKSDWDIKLSSAGLIYVHFGRKILSCILGKEDITDPLVDALFEKVIFMLFFISFSDLYSINTSLSSRVNRLNPAWNEPDVDENVCFQNALQLVDNEFVGLVRFYSNSWYPAREIVLKAVQSRYATDPSGAIIHLEGAGCPWNNNLNSTWGIQAIPLDEHNTFTQRLPLPESWRGLRDEQLSLIVGIPDCVFVHATGFLGIHKTREGVIQMAKLTMKMKNK